MSYDYMPNEYERGKHMLESHANKEMLIINRMEFLLTAYEDYITVEDSPTGEEYLIEEKTVVWVSEKYKILAIPGYFEVPIYVEVSEIEENGEENIIGVEEYYGEVGSFEDYAHTVKVLTEKILNNHKTQ